jgi:hypothetical protein
LPPTAKKYLRASNSRLIIPNYNHELNNFDGQSKNLKILLELSGIKTKKIFTKKAVASICSETTWIE